MTDQRPLPPYVGCTDGGCVFGHPGGMHTNGGCHCLDDLRELYGAAPEGLYARVRSGLLRLRMRLERAEAEEKATRQELERAVRLQGGVVRSEDKTRPRWVCEITGEVEHVKAKRQGQ